MTRTGRFLLTLPLFLAVASGCNTSNTPATVSGKITYNGQTVPAGSITFHPVATQSTDKGGLGIYNYSLKEDGTYSGTDLPTGEMVVTIETETANPNPTKSKTALVGGANKGDTAADYQKKMQEMGKAPSGPTNAGPYVKIPPKYAVKATSTLKVTLDKGKNTKDFELTD